MLSLKNAPHLGQDLRFKISGYTLNYFFSNKSRIIHMLDLTYDEDMCTPSSKQSKHEKPC